MSLVSFCFFFFFNDTATTEIYTLSLHDALPISGLMVHQERRVSMKNGAMQSARGIWRSVKDLLGRSEEHTSELQSLTNLVCRLLLEKKKEGRKRDQRTDC